MRWIAVIFGLALGSAGAAFIAVEYVKQPSHDIYIRLNKDEQVATAELEDVVHRQEMLSAWGWKDAELLKISALAEYTLASRSNDASESKTLLNNAINHLSEGLALSPADPGNWLRLANLRMQTGAPPASIINALSMSITTGPSVSQLIIPRLQLALIYWDQLQESEQAAFMCQIQLVKRWDPQKAQELAAMSERNLHLFTMESSGTN